MQSSTSVMLWGPYAYDDIGELKSDASVGITNIVWTVYEKVQQIWKNGTLSLEFLYDGAGRRVRKTVYGGAEGDRSTYYVYEAGGNVVAIYENCISPEPPENPDDYDGDMLPNGSDPCPCDANPGCQPPVPAPPPDDFDQDGIPNSIDLCPCEAGPAPHGCPDPCGSDFKLIEWPIYGSAAVGRIASAKPTNLWRPAGDGTSVSQPESIFTRILDEKYYELKDHLGNVRVVVLDRKQPATQTGQAPYQAVLRSYSNYYPYGMLQPSRNWQAGNYRYGFNGKEMDNEVAVTGGSYDGASAYSADL